MRKLAKHVIELEKQPVEKDNVITSNKGKRSARKVARDIKRKVQLGSTQQGSSKRVNFQHQQQHRPTYQNGPKT